MASTPVDRTIEDLDAAQDTAPHGPAAEGGVTGTPPNEVDAPAA